MCKLKSGGRAQLVDDVNWQAGVVVNCHCLQTGICRRGRYYSAYEIFVGPAEDIFY